MASTYPASNIPGLPARPVTSKSSSDGVVYTFIVVLIASVLYYYYYTHVLKRSLPDLWGGGDSKKGRTPSSNPPDKHTQPTLTDTERDHQLKVCESRGVQHGTCMVNPATQTVSAKCDSGFYGTACSQRCVTGGTKATVYTAGFESGSENEATCKCPATSHFINTDPQSGCRQGDEQGTGTCEAGWHGRKCDKMGAFVSCEHGTQDPATGKCVEEGTDHCPDGFEGDRCQYRKGTLITSCKNGGILMADGTSCKCIPPYAGKTCELELPKCLPNSGKGCQGTGKNCPTFATFTLAGCDYCKTSNQPSSAKWKGCCSENYEGCLASQAPQCVDKNTYPCVTDTNSLGHYMISSGVEMTPEQVQSYRV